MVHSIAWAMQASIQEIHEHTLTYVTPLWTSLVQISCHNELRFPLGNRDWGHDHTHEGAYRMWSSSPS